jgi:hypothetical protein
MPLLDDRAAGIPLIPLRISLPTSLLINPPLVITPLMVFVFGTYRIRHAAAQVYGIGRGQAPRCEPPAPNVMWPLMFDRLVMSREEVPSDRL